VSPEPNNPAKGKWVNKNVCVGHNTDSGKSYFERRKVFVPDQPGTVRRIFNKVAPQQPVLRKRENPPSNEQATTYNSIDLRDAARNAHLLGDDKYND